MFIKNRYIYFPIIYILSALSLGVFAQTKTIFDPELNKPVEKIERFEKRVLRYTPEGDGFSIVNGKKKFNRALYGTHTGFRVETSDLPEFALYLPRMGGNLSFEISNKTSTKKLNDVDYIKSIYKPGSRIYIIRDKNFTGKGEIRITALAVAETEGMILKIETEKIPKNTKLRWIFGGCADKRFSREGDLGVDPEDSFELKPDYCKGNIFKLRGNAFQVSFGEKNDKFLIGIFPEKSKLKIDKTLPVLKGEIELSRSRTYYIAIQIPDKTTTLKNITKVFSPLQHRPLTIFDTDPIYEPKSPLGARKLFELAEAARSKVASQLVIETPDPYFNTLGGTLSVAADGIWSGETWLHGAVGWRMPLSGWRAAYTGDALGWHERSRKHFDAYGASQVTNVPPIYPHPSQDTALNLARAEKKWGTQMYSNGYICRNPNRNDQMHHYDMNLCYIDQLIRHFDYTGDLEYARKMWPVIIRHLEWEKRNFDPDDDGLYDAYCCIWASDALYYNSGAATHSSAYNYFANKKAAVLAQKIGENPAPFIKESEKILKALNAQLWLPYKGHWAEYKDFMGDRKVHESAAVWTIYHAIDSETADPFQAFQATRYVDTEIPHIPVEADGIGDSYATISTTNWMPYSWSINNVAFAEVMHTTLAYWQAGRNNEAFRLLKSSVLDGMYMGASPGNVGQISYYDAARGECYRDFGDPVGVLSRVITEGLFGIRPDGLNNTLVIRPGFPDEWNFARMATPVIRLYYRKTGSKSEYTIIQQAYKKQNISLQIKANFENIESITANGKPVTWKLNAKAIAAPEIIIETPVDDSVKIDIITKGKQIFNKYPAVKVMKGQAFKVTTQAIIEEIYDPQKILSKSIFTIYNIDAIATGFPGHRTFFAKLRQDQMVWWQPFMIEITEPEKTTQTPFNIENTDVLLPRDIDMYFNDSVSRIFKNKYLSPRSPYTTLQIPTQGIGEWCHPLTTAEIDDSGLRKIAAENRGTFNNVLNIPFRTPATGKNIAFTSLWDNFPRKITIPVNFKARNAYLMLAGTTNHMQSRFVNGLIVANYTDGTKDTLKLINPDNWCPIEQDYFVDGKAFKLDVPRPYRVHLKTGLVSNNLEKDLQIEGVYGRKIDGGAGVLLDMPLNKNKTLLNISLETTANDVIIGLMSLTLRI
jgi:hypothetical protein